jgi:hypothetical protein
MPASARLLLAALIGVGGVLGACTEPSADWLGPGGTVAVHRAPFADDAFGRAVSVWRPPGYDTTRADGYPVLYVQGSRPLLRADGTTRRALDTLARRVEAGRLPPVLVVGLPRGERRLREVLPRVPFYLQPDSVWRPFRRRRGRPLADAYLQYLYEEVTAFVNRRYHTDPAASRTLIAGTGVDGLFALYAVAKIPFAFGGAALWSPDWTPGRPGADTAFVTSFRDYLAGQWGALRSARLYLDHVAGAREAFAPHRAVLDSFVRARGLPADRWAVRPVGRRDSSWPGRVEAALRFLLDRPPPRDDRFFNPFPPSND